MSVVIETTIGDITVDLYLKERPNTCLNFLKLCKIKYYNLCLFYKIEKNFVAQTGDPTATGRGGESVFCHLYGEQAKYFESEFKPRLKHEKVGTLSMVNNGNNMNGSQFFLTLGENLTYLDENHTVFGEVAEGFDILLKLNDAICDENHRPYQDIRITHTVILHDPFEDPNGLEIPDASPEPTKEMLESGYIRADEEIDDNKGKSMEEIEEKIKESEAKARATILEMVGDIPDAEVKPPENVLFVCKLNPVTTSEDLEIIFSRFGKILSCEVIKDKKTGDSLQYAFIEFEKEEDCEAAYFKMDNVLIDDRRIHVDFSQSVSKLNFDKNNKWISKPVKSNVTLKDNRKQSDGYDLIFDIEGTTENRTSKYESSSRRKRHHSHSEEREVREKDDQFRYDKSYYNAKNDKNYSGKPKISDRYSSVKDKSYEQSRHEKRHNDQRIDKYQYEQNRSNYEKKYKESTHERYRSSKNETSYEKRSKDTKVTKYYSEKERSIERSGFEKRHNDAKNDRHYSKRDKISEEMNFEKRYSDKYLDRTNRFREDEHRYSTNKSRDADQDLKRKSNRYSLQDSSRGSRDHEHYEKYPKAISKQNQTSVSKDSSSSDSPKRTHDKKQLAHFSKKQKKSYSEDDEETTTKKLKTKKPHSLSKHKKSRMPSSSSSSSESDSSSSSSSSGSSDYKQKRKFHRKEKVSSLKSKPQSKKKEKKLG